VAGSGERISPGALSKFVKMIALHISENGRAHYLRVLSGCVVFVLIVLISPWIRTDAPYQQSGSVGQIEIVPKNGQFVLSCANSMKLPSGDNVTASVQFTWWYPDFVWSNIWKYQFYSRLPWYMRRLEITMVYPGSTLPTQPEMAVINAIRVGGVSELSKFSWDEGQLQCMPADVRSALRTGIHYERNTSLVRLGAFVIDIGGAVGAVLLVRSFIAARRSARALRNKQLGLCVHCGYVLRNTGSRCSECGRIDEDISSVK